MLAYRDAMQERGYQIGDGVFAIDETLPPGRVAAEFAMNTLLRQSTADTDAAIAALVELSQGMKIGATMRCDRLWCYDMTGVGRMRFLVRDTPNCAPVTGGRTDCTFPVRFILSLKYGGQTPWNEDETISLMNDILRGVRQAAGDQTVSASFHRADNKWTIGSLQYLR